jgi:hypothetical protein
MRLKVDIQPFDRHRIIFWGTKGLSEKYINAINNLAQKEEWHDVLFATLDDNRVALVCKPATGAKIIRWDRNKNKQKYPEGFEEDFLREANQALYSNDIRLYVEKLTRDEEELKKQLYEEVGKIRGKEINDEDKTWEKDET